MIDPILSPAGDRPRRHACLWTVCAATVFGISGAAHTQEVPPRNPAEQDSLSLSALQDAAVRSDPRTVQLDALTAQTALRLENLEREWLPTPTLNGQAQYQSDVVHFPVEVPDVIAVLRPPNDTYDAHLATRVGLYDPTRRPRAAVERANLVESRARVETELYSLRQNVNEAFFAALRADAQRAEIESSLTAIEAQLGVARDRLRERAILPSGVESLEVELLRRRQSLGELDAACDAALAVLAALTGHVVESADALPLPDLGDLVARVRATPGLPGQRPEYEQFAAAHEAIDRQAEVVAAQDLPRVSAVGRAGYGRPGLNPLAIEFDTYWLAGLQLEWTPWNWGTRRREREILDLQREVVASEEAAFSEALRRRVANDLATMDRLEQALAEDDGIVALRERILDETRLRHTEGVITSAEFVDRQTDVLAARIARALHRVQLAEARARFLTTLGIEIP